ncbi:MAG TPA: bifunctional UDP-sugar hydrolase/5'-nucleotidase [Lachnospiraceae bacterium]|nr:bifunctional UDP-sugar hydrolase/5'-nucleotidase [Lachnospiraceae bacterium]
MKNLKKLVLLHSNDMHGDFLAENIDSSLVGGVSMLSGYVNKVRREEPNTIYAIAGDMFRGSVIDSEYQGISTIEIMNLLAPDVVTIGNHEADYGLGQLLFIEKCAKFPIINANLFIRTGHNHLFQPYVILRRDGMKILFIGIVTEEVLNKTKRDGMIGSFVDIDEAAAEIGRICDTYNAIDIDFTVLLTHIGYEEDKKLAAKLDPAWGVDVIIGGHSHTLLEKATEINGVQIVQAGIGTNQIGRFDIMVDTDRNCIDSFTWKTIPICAENCPRDEEVESLILNYKKATDEKYGRIVTRFTRELTHPSRTQETELGDLFADILQNALGLDVFFIGSGSIRSTKLGPVVRLSDFEECFPYDDAVFLVKVTGAQLKKMILFYLRDEAFEGDHTEFYQISGGLRLIYEKKEHTFREIKFGGADVDDSRIYSTGIQAFHYANFEKFFGLPQAEIEKNAAPRPVATSCRSILEEVLSGSHLLDQKADGRITIE